MFYLGQGYTPFFTLRTQNRLSPCVLNNSLFPHLAVGSCVTADQVRQFVTAIIQAYDAGVLVTDTQTSASQWDYASSTFFAMTAVTTIGQCY